MRTLKKDLLSSVVVFLVALPLCLGIALASGAPPIAGILAGIVGGIVIGAFSGSHTSVSGPAAGLTVIVLAGISQVGGYSNFTLAVMLSGIIQILFGVFKLDRAGNYFPNSVIKGMLASIGIILILKQFPHAIGYDFDFMGDQSFEQRDGHNTFSNILYAWEGLHKGALIVSALGFFSYFTWSKLQEKINAITFIPASLIVVILGIVTNHYLEGISPDFKLASNHLVQIASGTVEQFFSQLQFPNWAALTNPNIYKVAFTIAMVGSLESLLSLDAADKIDPHKRNSSKNREMFAQGIGNTLGGFIGALPITAVIVRTSANITAGAETKKSAILHGFWLLMFTLFFPGLLNQIPLSALAVILILVGYKLTSLKILRSFLDKSKDQLIPFFVTIVAILFTDLLMGIAIGLATGIIFVIKTNIHESFVLVNDEKNYLLRFMKDANFLDKPKFTDLLHQVPDGSSLIIDGSNSVFIDDDIVQVIEDFLTVAEERQIKVTLEKSSLALNPLFKDSV